MGKIKMYAVVSLDGFTARADGDVDWVIKYTKKEDYGFREFSKTIDHVLINHNQYTLLQSYDFRWPYRDLPCYVITDESFVFPRDRDIRFMLYVEGMDYLSQVEDLRNGEKGDIWLAGDHKLVTAMLQRDIVDEVTLVMLPITIGHGIPLSLGNARENRWELVSEKKYDSGVVRLRYKKKNN